MNQNNLIAVDLGDSSSIYAKIIKDNYIPKYLRDIVLITGRRESYKYIPFVIDTNNIDIDHYIAKLNTLVKKELDIEYNEDELNELCCTLETIIVEDNLYIKTTLDKMYSLFGVDLLKLLPFINMSMELANQYTIYYYVKTYHEIDYEAMPIFLNNRYFLNEIDLPEDFKDRLLAIRDKSPDSFIAYKWYTDTFKYVIFGKEKLDTLEPKEISDVLMTWPILSIGNLFTLLGYNINCIGLMKTITYTLVYNDAIKNKHQDIEDALEHRYAYLEILQDKLIEKEREIELYEEDDTTYEEEELEEIKAEIKDTLKQIESLEEQIDC